MKSRKAPARAGAVERRVAAELGRSQVPAHDHRILKVEAVRPYTGLKPVRVETAPSLPERFLGPEGISIPVDHALTPAEMAQHITASTGLPVRFVGRVPPGAGARTFTGRGGRVLGGVAQWTGPLPELLDEWTGELGYEWRYDEAGGAVEVVRGVSVVFGLHALGGQQRYGVSSSTSGGGSGSAGGASSRDFARQSLSTSYDYNPWPELDATLKAMVSGETLVSVSPAQASVLVRGLPGDVAKVRAYLRHVNRTILRPIVVTVRVFSVSRESGADFETDFSAALRSISGGSYDFVLEGGRGVRSVGLVRPGAGVEGNSLELTVKALRSLGTVSRVLSAGVPALNGAPAQYYELVKHTYLAEVTTSSGESGVEQELKPGEIASGFAMSYVGRITGPGEVLLRIFASLQDAPKFGVFGTGQNRIQLPEFASRGISVTQAVREGETLVLSGFTDRVVSSEREGMVVVDNPLAGGVLHGDRRIDQVLLLSSRVGEPAGVSEVSEVLL